MGASKSKALPAPNAMGSSEEALIAYYEAKVRPMEERHLFADFYSPPLDSAELSGKPSVLILGQYSVGKTSMISYLLNEEYPEAHIGPEPTTDVFVFIQHGTSSHTVPGPALVSDKSFPFRALSKFGADFLNKLRGATMTSSLLKDLTFIDTPGILSGEKQRVNRGYDFHKVVKFLAEKVDRIWVLFDTSKMDISDEFKLVLNCLVGNDEKLRIILNKADAVKADELVRVRGALMWNLGKILTTPEVPQVVIGSFWDQELKRTELRDAFYQDYKSLMKDLHDLPTNAPIRKITDVVKRAKKVEVHALIMNEILKRGAPCGGVQGAIKKWTTQRNMKRIFTELEIVEKVSPYDFPIIEDFAAACERTDYRKWHKIRAKDRESLHTFLNVDVSNILEAQKTKKGGASPAAEADGSTPASIHRPKNLIPGEEKEKEPVKSPGKEEKVKEKKDAEGAKEAGGKEATKDGETGESGETGSEVERKKKLSRLSAVGKSAVGKSAVAQKPEKPDDMTGMGEPGGQEPAYPKDPHPETPDESPGDTPEASVLPKFTIDASGTRQGPPPTTAAPIPAT